MKPFLVLLLGACTVASAADVEWKIGTVADSTMSKRVEDDKPAPLSGLTFHRKTYNDTTLAIAGDEFLYVVSQSAAAKIGPISRNGGCHFIVNDPIKYAVDKNSLRVTDKDGRQCKMEIVRQERVNKAESRRSPQ